MSLGDSGRRSDDSELFLRLAERSVTSLAMTFHLCRRIIILADDTDPQETTGVNMRPPSRRQHPSAKKHTKCPQRTGLLKYRKNVTSGSDFLDETTNVRSFGKASLWGSIGGYVGMILGFSFLQVPDIISGIMYYIQSKKLF